MNKSLLAFKLECSLIGIITVLFFILSPALSITFGNLVFGILTAILGLLITAKTIMKRPYLQVIDNLAKMLLVLTFPATLLTSICLSFSSIMTANTYVKWGILAAILAIFGVLLLPFIKIILMPQSQIGWQIASSILLMTSFFSTSLNAFQYLKIPFTLNLGSPIIWILIIGNFTIAIYLMIYWGYRLPRLKINTSVNYWWLLLAVVTLLLNMGLSAGSWMRLLTNFDLTLAQNSLLIVLFTIIWTGLKEEFMFRYLFLWPLASIKRVSIESRVFWSSLISALFFGLCHAQNLTEQGVLQTCLQIFAAFGIGFLFSVIALYTGTIWISVVIHCMIDLIGFPINNGGAFSGNTSWFLVEFILLTRIIELIVAFLLIKNKNNQRAFSETLSQLRSDESKLLK
ncbi:CPBP family intramembrane glutamic endopeptidase [Lentilactobacillus hilgardii]|uniref:CPBP family intramembrane glutamic endopeptidase n=1 Tax=Lentilactobacillus hilgardii TaxID=1588 RepID=UPI0021A2C0DB|nr:CPBP family intramembrane glutamic endopeptidase [Lentilactobacillus hilgardii]MCT3398481.1 CPBP family intramembrane metalloprotease [Lentilactobacillus hilgardii]